MNLIHKDKQGAVASAAGSTAGNAGGTGAPDSGVPNPFANAGTVEAARVKRRIPTQTIILLLVMGVSAAALFSMRQLGLRSGVQFEEVKLDGAGPDAEKAKTYERIMADLQRLQTPLDVALGEFGKSPFMLETSKTSVTAHGEPVIELSPEERAAIAAREAAATRLAEIQDKAARLEVNGILAGRVPIARINGHAFRIGDIVDELFTVTAIDGRSVTVEAEGESFVLTMEASPDRAPKRSPARIGKPENKSGGMKPR